MNTTLRYIIIIVLGALLFFPMLGHVHLFDWDEINFAECAREMIVSHDYLRVQIDFKPFWEKPPMFIWMQVLSMKVLGINEYAARFPNALMGVATLVTLYYVGKRVLNEKMATWWVLLYAATWLPHFYFKSGIIDPTFNFFIFVSFFQVYLLKHGTRPMLHALLAGMFLGLAVLTKGPVAILVFGLSFVVYIIVNRGLSGYKTGSLITIAVATVITALLWFGVEVLNHGWGLIHEFISYQIRLFRTEDADHGGPLFYHFIVLLIGCFPASLFLFQFSRKHKIEDNTTGDFTRWMWILFWVVLLLFSIVKTKIVHYSSLCYFPLTYLAAYQIYRLSERRRGIKKEVTALLLIVGSLLAIVITALPLVGIYKQQLIPYIDDPFAVGNLQAAVTWSYAECLFGITYLLAIWIAAFVIKKHFRKGMLALLVVQVIMIQIAIVHFTPKVEAYSQRAAIDFFKGLEGKDVYVKALGYKSYAQLFYSKMPHHTNENYYNEDWLLHGNIDKPAYFICKITASAPYRLMPELQLLGEKNGFVFFKRR